MLVVVAYDVNTETKEGRRRLRRVALACKDYGQRVQKSVFECLVEKTQLVALRDRLLKEIDQESDSLRLYFLDDRDRKRIEHYGCKRPMDLEEPFVV
jgi:CRISPR-associated protein Cas2